MLVRENPRYMAVANKAIVSKIDALVRLAAMAGDKSGPLLIEEDAHFARAAAAIIVIASPTSGPLQKAACAAMLDVYMPGWRGMATLQVLGGISKREDALVRKWRKNVLDRDGHRCANCQSPHNLQAHHVLSWAGYPWARILVENGTTLCKSCHIKAHTRTH